MNETIHYVYYQLMILIKTKELQIHINICITVYEILSVCMFATCFKHAGIIFMKCYMIIQVDLRSFLGRSDHF